MEQNNSSIPNIEQAILSLAQTMSNALISPKDLPHKSGLLCSLDYGMVFTNTQIIPPYDTVYSGQYGLVATTGSSSKITVTRDGLYEITFHFKCIDVTSNPFITWLYINRGGTLYVMRRPDQTINVGLGSTMSFTLHLLAGDFVYQNIYSGSGATRFGAANVGTASGEANRILGMSMMMYEIR